MPHVQGSVQTVQLPGRHPGRGRQRLLLAAAGRRAGAEQAGGARVRLAHVSGCRWRGKQLSMASTRSSRAALPAGCTWLRRQQGSKQLRHRLDVRPGPNFLWTDGSLCACRERMKALYVYLVGLERYIDLNREGFRKALKVTWAFLFASSALLPAPLTWRVASVCML